MKRRALLKTKKTWTYTEHIAVPDDLKKPPEDRMALCGRPMEYGSRQAMWAPLGVREKFCEDCDRIAYPIKLPQPGRGSQMRGWRPITERELESLQKLTREDLIREMDQGINQALIGRQK